MHRSRPWDLWLTIAGFYAAAEIAATFLQQTQLASLAVQAIAAEWLAGRIGVAWHDLSAAPPSARAIAERGAVAFGAGLATAAATFFLITLPHGASIHVVSPVLAEALPALLAAAMVAVRDELFLRGAAFRLLGPAPAGAKIGLGALASLAMTLGHDGLELHALVRETAFGAFYGSLWLVGRGAWLPVVAHTAALWSLHSSGFAGVLEASGGATGASPFLVLAPLAATLVALWAAPKPTTAVEFPTH